MFVILNAPWRQAANGMKSWFMMNTCAISRIDFDPERDQHRLTQTDRSSYQPFDHFTHQLPH